VVRYGLEYEVTRAGWIGDSSKSVETMLSNGAAKEPSKSQAARELILDILDAEGEQESDGLDARVALETELAVGTIRNARTRLSKQDGLIRNYPQKDEFGEITRWLVGRTGA